MKSLTIGIDIHSIGSHTAGNETYYRELITSLSKANSSHKFILYYTHRSALEQLPRSPNFKFQRLSPGHRLLRIPFTFPLRAHRDKLDVFHAQYIIPPVMKCKSVTTIPDIAYERFPDFFPILQRAWMKTLIPWSARRADHIITVSNHSKMDIARTYCVPEEKITVTYEAAGSAFSPGNKDEARERIAQRYGIQDRFILYLGRLQARKNLARLIEAYAHLRESGVSQKLVLAGKEDSLFGPVRSRVEKLRLTENVVFPGYIASEDVPSFYNAADVFVYPSIYEGFGLPLMEAMACGVPVITSKASSLEEVAGDAALLIDPYDVFSIAEALRRVLGDRVLSSQLGTAGLLRSRTFSFENAAKQTLAVYERVMGFETGRKGSPELVIAKEGSCL